MTNTDIKLLVLSGGCGIFLSLLGVHGIVNRKKINKVSDYYMSINLLLTGIMSAISFLVFLFFFWLEAKGISIINKKTFYLLGSIWGGIMMLVGGMHGIINKKKINSRPFLQLSVSAVISSIIMFVGVIAFCMRWGWR